MKKFLAAILGVVVVSSGSCFAADKVELKDDSDRVNYSIGYQIGGDFQRQHWELRSDVLMKGLNDALNRETPLMSQEEMNAVLQMLKRKLTADQQKEVRENDKAFLEANAKKEGVVVLPSGVQYRVIKEGAGRKPTLSDSVVIKYQVSRIIGQKVTPASAETKPTAYPMKKALPGLQETLQLMKEGAVWEIVLPPGPSRGVRGEALESAPVLIYQMELFTVKEES
ncbi:MAG: peptidylprolyl isomerase [Deltaproteobacteria bacterium]|nr:peptidylprolyl isomerase [Deltaproteobacteria bacterium]